MAIWSVRTCRSSRPLVKPALDGLPRHSYLPTRHAIYLCPCPCNPRSLDQLGYRQPLGIESVPLVERLFSDLVHTTESLKNIKVRPMRDLPSDIQPRRRSLREMDGGGGGGGRGGWGSVVIDGLCLCLLGLIFTLPTHTYRTAWSTPYLPQTRSCAVPTAWNARQVELGTKEKKSTDVTDYIEPYRADNAKLVKEVNQLHLELIRRKDAADVRGLGARLACARNSPLPPSSAYIYPTWHIGCPPGRSASLCLAVLLCPAGAPTPTPPTPSPPPTP